MFIRKIIQIAHENGVKIQLACRLIEFSELSPCQCVEGISVDFVFDLLLHERKNVYNRTPCKNRCIYRINGAKPVLMLNDRFKFRTKTPCCIVERVAALFGGINVCV